MALALLAVIIGLLTEIIVLYWGLTESNLLFRSVRERAILDSISKFEFAKRFQSQALTFSFYKTYELLGGRGGYYQFPEGLKSKDCIPYWKIYSEEYVPDIREEISKSVLSIFNQYMQLNFEENLQLPTYEKIDVAGEMKERKWCEEKTCQAGWGTSCKVGGICVEKDKPDPYCTYTECWWGWCVGACFPWIGVCSETKACKATCVEDPIKCPPTIPTLEATAITSSNLVFEREKIKIEESGKFSQNISAGLLYEHYLGKLYFITQNNISESIQEAITVTDLQSTGSLTGTCGGGCPSIDDVFSDANGISIEDAKILIKNKIEEKIKELENELNQKWKKLDFTITLEDIKSDVRNDGCPVTYDSCTICLAPCEIPETTCPPCPTDEEGNCLAPCQITYNTCPPCPTQSSTKCTRTCNFYYYGAVDTLITIKNLEKKFLIGNQFKTTPLKFRVIEENGTGAGYIYLISPPSTEDCQLPV